MLWGEIDSILQDLSIGTPPPKKIIKSDQN